MAYYGRRVAEAARHKQSSWHPEMRFHQTTLRPLLRSLAALTLVLFVAAQAACFAHCYFCGGHGSEAGPSCHGVGAAEASHHEPHSPAPSDPATSVACVTLKTLVAGGDAYTLVAPVLQPVDFLAPSSLVLNAPEAELDAAFRRQAKTRDWVFTPEVCLGPAFRSLAPPVVS